MAHQPLLPLPRPSALQQSPHVPLRHAAGQPLDEERMRRVAAAVALVEWGRPAGGRVSVRKAASLFGLPKSTVHRYVQANRGIDAPRRRPARRARTIAPPRKCGIAFLLGPPAPTAATSRPEC